VTGSDAATGSGSVDAVGSASGSASVDAVQVLAGSPSPEELAAVIAVLQAQAEERERAGRARVEESPRSAWDASARGLRRPLDHGIGAWTRSLR
jgi:hypothetical protein